VDGVERGLVVERQRGDPVRDPAEIRSEQRPQQLALAGRAAGCLITGNEDGIKHCAMNILYSLHHVGYAIPPNADAGWIGEAGPRPSYLDPGSGGPDNDFTNRNTFMTGT